MALLSVVLKHLSHGVQELFAVITTGVGNNMVVDVAK